MEKDLNFGGSPETKASTAAGKANESIISASRLQSLLEEYLATDEAVDDLANMVIQATGHLFRALASRLDYRSYYQLRRRLLKRYVRELNIASSNEEATRLPLPLLSRVARRISDTTGTYSRERETQQPGSPQGGSSIGYNEPSDSFSSRPPVKAALGMQTLGESLPALHDRLSFAVEGEAFHNLWGQLRYQIEAPETVGHCLMIRDVHLVTAYLEHRFEDAAQGNYPWIEGLRDAGYAVNEIAQLIYEKTFDSPWIYFERDEKNLPAKLLSEYHVEGCIHHEVSAEPVRPKQDKQEWIGELEGKEQQRRRKVEELCGLGGISPSSRMETDWSGSAAFHRPSARASILHRPRAGSLLDSSPVAALPRLTSIAGRLSQAFALVQLGGGCCDTFTILNSRPASTSGDTPQVMMVRLPFNLNGNLLENLSELQNLLQQERPSEHILDIIYETAREIIVSVLGRSRSLEEHRGSMENTLHYASLALQLLSVRFLSYAQAHIGPLQPFFLDMPLKAIALQGIHPGHPIQASATLVKLTCLGGLCQGPVLAFCYWNGSEEVLSASPDQMSHMMHDVRARLEDVLDTWGPGAVMSRTDIERYPVPVAIKLGTGYISPPSSTKQDAKYHWGTQLDIPLRLERLDLTRYVVIGGLVTENSGCPNNEASCWEASSGQFEELGAYRAYTEVTEHHAGFQGGPGYFSVTTNRVWGKCRGKTIKSRNLERKDAMLIPFLSFYWGVRVSFCTGVAQRVPLTTLVADLLPAFAKALAGPETETWWGELETCHAIISQLMYASSDSLSGWLKTLPTHLYLFVLRLVRQILSTLEDTGISREGTHFIVAWPHNGIVNRCFHIPLSRGRSHDNKWAFMLADSDDCATFAYMTNACLEAGSHLPCRGPDPPWLGKLSLLESAVLRPENQAPGAQLKPEQSYFFNKLDNSLVWVKAGVCKFPIDASQMLRRPTFSQPQHTALVRLESMQSLPRDIVQRLLFREERRYQRRIRERDLDWVPADKVYVLSYDMQSTEHGA